MRLLRVVSEVVDVGMEKLRMSMLLGGAEKMSPVSSVMVGMVLMLSGGRMFVRNYDSWWVCRFGRCLEVEKAHG